MRFEVSNGSGSGAETAAFPKAFSDTVFGVADGLNTKSPQSTTLGAVMSVGAVMSDTDSIGPGGRIGIKASGTEHQHFLRRQFFHKEPCDYSHRVYKNAGSVFTALRHETVDDGTAHVQWPEPGQASAELSHLKFSDETEKRLTFTLVYQTLKYQNFLEDMLTDASFFPHYPEFREDAGLVVVILCDFQKRRFQQRWPFPGEQLDENLVAIEKAILLSKTKLNAALARSRIRARVLSIDSLLPDSVRENERISCGMRIHCWVNRLKTTMGNVVSKLSDDGYEQLTGEEEPEGKRYVVDTRCTDLLCFAGDQRHFLEEHALIKSGHIVIQDKSSSLGPHAVRAMMNDGDDVMHVNIGTGLTTAHLASLIPADCGSVIAVGVGSEAQRNKARQNIDVLGAKSKVKLFTEDLLDIDVNDERFKNVKVALVTAECSRSGVVNPVNFIVSEGEDMNILKKLSRGTSDDGGGLGELMVKHSNLLKHVLNFPKMQGVIYCTRSVYAVENEAVVIRSIEYVNGTTTKKCPFRVAPPVLPLSEQDIENGNLVGGKYLHFQPSCAMSGCFLATITREADDLKEAAKDILARAAAKGLLGGVDSGSVKRAKSQGSRKYLKRRDTSKSRKDATNAPLRAPRQLQNIAMRMTGHSPTGQVSDSGRSPTGQVSGSPSQHRMPPPSISSMPTTSAATTSSPHKPVTTNFHGYHPLPPTSHPLPPTRCAVTAQPVAVLQLPEPEHEKVIKHPKPFR